MTSANLERLAQSGSLKQEPADQREAVEDAVWRVLALCHDRRNRAEYEGEIDIDEQLVSDLLKAATAVQAQVTNLGPID